MPGIASAHILHHVSSPRVYLLQNLEEGSIQDFLGSVQELFFCDLVLYYIFPLWNVIAGSGNFTTVKLGLKCLFLENSLCVTWMLPILLKESGGK